MTAHGDAQEGKWRRNWRMEWVASTLHTTSEHGVSSITTADAHTSVASSRLNWRPRQFKWTRPFRRKTKFGFCACAITFQTQSTYTNLSLNATFHLSMYQHNMSLNVKCFHLWNFLKQKNRCYRLTCTCAICGYYGSDHEVHHLLRSNTTQSSRYVSIRTRGFEELTVLVFREEDCGYRFIQNVCTYLPDYKLSYTKRHTLLYISDRTVHDIGHITLFCTVQLYQWKNYSLYLRWSNNHFTFYVVSVDKTQVLHTQRQHDK